MNNITELGVTGHLRKAFIRPSGLSSLFVIALLIFLCSSLGGLAYHLVRYGGVPAPNIDFLKHAEQLTADGRKAEAIGELTGGLKVWPVNPKASFDAAVTAFELGDNEAAKAEFHRYLRYDPASVRSHYGLGIVYYQLAEFQPAIQHLTLAAKANVVPESANAYMSLGVLYEDLGRIQEARANYAKAIELGPQIEEIRARYQRFAQRHPQTRPK